MTETIFPNMYDALTEGGLCVLLRRDPHTLESTILTELLRGQRVIHAHQSPTIRRGLFTLELFLKDHTRLPTPLDYSTWLDETAIQDGIIRIPHAIDEYVFGENSVMFGYNNGTIFTQGNRGIVIYAETPEEAYTDLNQELYKREHLADTQ